MAVSQIQSKYKYKIILYAVRLNIKTILAFGVLLSVKYISSFQKEYTLISSEEELVAVCWIFPLKMIGLCVQLLPCSKLLYYINSDRCIIMF